MVAQNQGWKLTPAASQMVSMALGWEVFSSVVVKIAGGQPSFGGFILWNKS